MTDEKTPPKIPKLGSGKVEMWPIKNLTPYDQNVKKHPIEQIAKICESIRRFGWADSNAIQVDKNGVIIAGHGRRLAALELGMKDVKVQVRHDLNPTQVREFRLAENRTAVSDLDFEMLSLEVADLDMSGIFDDKEVNFMSVDLGSVNADAFVTDMGAVLDDQKADIDARTEKAADVGTRIPVAKAFGFKDISAAGRLAITNLMAKAEAVTGLKNDEALVAWAGTLA